ncbi:MULTISPECIES: zinc ABC transporter substrate-binding protein AztC [unclassified Sinorhizobium]|uniref:zinc ABC transporter substrate-binding protein AztC n=1 Tax=unclassified Sinorhizobium TaxID=2613772 RepID=UPI0024C2D1ED|nr:MULTISPECIES: zinc ABC transporter substrate-binding protein AztC [unclassified Sinorhizobium]MDK1376468.1 zinc ABC transporter substrate-binding protein AztC [Sinorhizobium sp. 6-70]MDK1480984.1 zinc ABC transporter substrate-binding protein AztC [Sinorhizobium sp. 6-117]
MLRTLRVATSTSLLTLCAGFATTALAADLNVVASFSIIGDFARNVGGDRVQVKTIVGPDGDAHVYEPRPTDAVSIEQADVVLVNGLQFEGFMSRLVDTSGTKASLVEVSNGIEPLKTSEEDHAGEKDEDGAHGDDHGHGHGGHHHHGEFDPHAWQSVKNAEIYVKNIADAFCEADKAGCATYTANSQAYIAALAELDEDVKASIESIPADKRTIITSHDAFGYFERDYGLKFIAPEGISTEADASAADVAKLIDQVKEDKASAIFLENITNPRLIEQIAAETGLVVGGTLYSDALSGEEGPSSTYIDMIRHNVDTLKSAIQGS